VIDLHSHILPGLDDGTRSLEEAVELAQSAAADGVTVIAATPHVRHDYPTSAGEMEHALARVRAAVAEAGVKIDVIAGGEIDLVELSRLSDEELFRFSYAALGKHVLLEFPDAGWPISIGAAIDGIRTAGLTPILAHPERNARVQQRPELLERLIAQGAIVQVTAASLEGRLGRRALATSKHLVDHGLAHLLASDAHGPHIRGAGLAAAVARLGDEGLGRYLTEESPAAILAGAAPEAPPRPPRRTRWFGR
jgi:protein-tyrosine phosphatase